MTTTDENHDRVLETYGEAMQCLREGDSGRAAELGASLKEARFSGAFEVLALAHLDEDLPEEAEKILREGTAIAPHVWVLWQLLGSTLSDLARYEEADDAYRRALACPHVDADAVNANRAILRLREGRHADVISVAAKIASEPARTHARIARVDALGCLGRWGEAIADGESLVRELAARDDENSNDGLEARARVELALAYWRGRNDAAGARAMLAPARQASGPVLAEVARAELEIDPRTSPNARRYRLMIEGRWPEPDEDGVALGFVRTLEVVAEDPSAAMAFAATYVIAEARSSLVVDECHDDGSAADVPLGVHMVLGYGFFPVESDAS